MGCEAGIDMRQANIADRCDVDRLVRQSVAMNRQEALARKRHPDKRKRRKAATITR